MKDPFILRKAGDFITAKDWNDMQGMIRNALNVHNHNGDADQGVKLTGKAIDSNTSLTIKGLNVTGELKVDGTTTTGGAFSVNDALSVGKNITAKGSLSVENDLTAKDITAKGSLTVGNNLTVSGSIGIGKNSPKAKLDVNGDISGVSIHGDSVHGSSWSLTKKIDIDDHVTTESKTWQEIKHYTLTIETPALKCVVISLHIPFVGNVDKSARNRIRLDFDDKPISDATKGSQNTWELDEINLTGLVQDINKGKHTIKVFAAVDKGKLYIPHFNKEFNESMLKPSIFANLYLLGFY